MQPNKVLISAITASSLIYFGTGAFASREWGMFAAVVHTAVFLGLALTALVRHFSGILPGRTVLAGLILCSTGGTAGILLGSPLIMGPISLGMGLTGALLFRPVRREKAGPPDPDPEPAPREICETPKASGENIFAGVKTDQVMVADDDPEILEQVTAVLNRNRIPCTAVKNGEAALRMIAEGQVPGVLLLGMPRMSGVEICRRLRKRYPASELPILVLTERQGEDTLSWTYEAGASDYISRPFSVPELVTRVRGQLDLHRAYLTMKENLRLETEIRLQREMSRSASRTAEREGLEKLRYQLNPHFLFNALATIRGAVFSDRQAAHDMVTHLAEFCRLTLVRGREEVLTIEREMAIVSHYLAMERMRYGEYLSVSIQIQPGAETVFVPAFIIQPLVENAIKYGARTSPDFLDITILAACREEGRVMIRISNTGEWVAPGSGSFEKSTGTGIRNVRARLACFYGEDFLWEQESGSGSVSVSLILPDRIPGEKVLRHRNPPD